MTIWLTSDWHFFHNRDFIYQARGFDNIEDMNDAIIRKYNEKVNIGDIVYVLGDLCLGGASIEVLNKVKGFISLLKGDIYIIRGNHDTDNRIKMYQSCWNVHNILYADQIKYKGYHFYLSHYPAITNNLDEDKSLKQRVINLYGHTHQIDPFYSENFLMYNVGVDAHNCYPVNIEQIIMELKNKYGK